MEAFIEDNKSPTDIVKLQVGYIRILERANVCGIERKTKNLYL